MLDTLLALPVTFMTPSTQLCLAPGSCLKPSGLGMRCSVTCSGLGPLPLILRWVPWQPGTLPESLPAAYPDTIPPLRKNCLQLGPTHGSWWPHPHSEGGGAN